MRWRRLAVVGLGVLLVLTSCSDGPQPVVDEEVAGTPVPTSTAATSDATPSGCDPADSSGRRVQLRDSLTEIFGAQRAAIDDLFDDEDLSDEDLVVALVDMLGDEVSPLFDDAAHAREAMRASLAPAPECDPPQVEPTGDRTEDCLAFIIANWEWRGSEPEAAAEALAGDTADRSSMAVSFLSPILGDALEPLLAEADAELTGVVYTISNNLAGRFVRGHLDRSSLRGGIAAALAANEASIVQNLTLERDFNPDLDEADLANIDASLQSIETNGLSVAAVTFTGRPTELRAALEAASGLPLYLVVVGEAPDPIMPLDPSSIDSLRDSCEASPGDAEEASFAYRRHR